MIKLKGGGKMAGKIKTMIDVIVQKRSNGDKLLAEMTKTKIIMKGINIEHYSSTTPDDDKVIEKLKGLARELNLDI